MATKKRKTLTSVPQGKLGIIAMRGTEQFAKQVNDFISQSRKDIQYEHKDLVDFEGYQKDSYLIDVDFPRFST
ncbi:MAG: ribose-phosphate pyrophosphokinase, partial [Acutalibacteraceae bacterium]